MYSWVNATVKTDSFKVVFFSRDRSASDISFFRLRTANCLQSKPADSTKLKIKSDFSNDMG